MSGAHLASVVGATSAEIVDTFVERALGDGVTQEEASALVGDLATLLGSTDDQTPEDSLLNALVRRLDLDPDGGHSLETVVASLLSEIDPEETINTPEEMVAAIESWARANPANTLRIVSPADAVGPFPAWPATTFDSVVAQLAEYELAAAELDVPLAGVQGLDRLEIGRVRWDIDSATESITFTGVADVHGEGAHVMVAALWNDGSPKVIVGVHALEWSLDEIGIDAEIDPHPFAEVTWVISGSPQQLDEVALPPSFVEFVAANVGSAALADASIEQGINVIASAPLSILPDRFETAIGLDPNATAILHGHLGLDFNLLGGNVTSTDDISLRASLPPADLPLAPGWLRTAPNSAWQLSIETDGETVDTSIDGAVMIELDGGQVFTTSIDVTTSDRDPEIQLRAESAEPWESPFGLRWLTIDDVAFDWNVADGDGEVEFTAGAELAGRRAGLTFAIPNTQTPGAVDLMVELERVDVQEIATFVADKAGADAPASLPDLSLRDIRLHLRSGDVPTIALSAKATVIGQEADIVVSALPQQGRPRPQLIVGVHLTEWSLGQLTTDGDSALDEIAIPSSALIVSSVDGRVSLDDVSPLVTEFFQRASTDAGSSLALKPGVSAFATISLAGTSMETPMATLGFDATELTLIGTLPGKQLGLGGDGDLNDLSLTVALPEITNAGDPEWLKAGKLFLRIRGSGTVELGGTLTLEIDGELLDLTITGGVGRRGLSFTGTLVPNSDGAPEAWVAPFGQEWLTIKRLAVGLSIKPQGSVTFDVGGEVELGGKDVRAGLAVTLHPSVPVPVPLALTIESADGISIADLAAVQAGLPNTPGLIDLGSLPDIAFRNITLTLALRASDAAEIPEPGVTVEGEAWITMDGEPPKAMGQVAVSVTRRGVSAAWNAPTFGYGPLQISDASLDLDMAVRTQKLELKGTVTFLGVSRAVDISLSNESTVFNGSARERLQQIERAFNAFRDDPAGAIRQLRALLESADTEIPDWLQPLLDAVETLPTPSTNAIETLLASGSFLDGAPSEPYCVGLPMENTADGLCYPALTKFGTPSGGVPTVPGCSGLYVLNPDDGRCYLALPSFFDSDGTPSGGSAPIQECPWAQPWPQNGRCWFVTPSDPMPTGEPKGCPALHELVNGSCYRWQPFADDFPDMPTSLASLVNEIRERLVERVSQRLDRW